MEKGTEKSHLSEHLDRAGTFYRCRIEEKLFDNTKLLYSLFFSRDSALLRVRSLNLTYF